MTAKRVGEFIQELPSKRSLVRFASLYAHRPVKDLEDELVDHFGLLRRDIHVIARCIRELSQEQDFEFGYVRKMVMNHIVKMQDSLISTACTA